MRVIYNEEIEKKSQQLYFCSHMKNTNSSFSRLMHSHEDFVEILLIVSGEGIYKIDGKNYSVKAGDMLIFNSLVAHEEFLEQAPVLETFCCGIKGLSDNHLGDNALIADNTSPLFSLYHYTDIVKSYMKLIYQLLSHRKGREAQLLMETFLDFLRNNILKHLEVFTDEQDDIFLHRVKQYIETNFYEDLNLKALAKKVNVSPYYLSHQFKEKFDCAPVKYLIKRRIGEAQTLLQNSDLAITEIGFMVGFNNPSHFQTTFKKMVGMTPKQYRKLYETSNDTCEQRLMIRSLCLNVEPII